MKQSSTLGWYEKSLGLHLISLQGEDYKNLENNSSHKIVGMTISTRMWWYGPKWFLS